MVDYMSNYRRSTATVLLNVKAEDVPSISAELNMQSMQ